MFDAALGRQVEEAAARAAHARVGARRAADRRPLPTARRPAQRARSPASRRSPGSPSATARLLPAGRLHPRRGGQRARGAAGREGARAGLPGRRSPGSRRDPGRDLTVAVNLSSRQFEPRRPAVGGQVDAGADRAGAELPPSRAHRDGDHGPAPRHPAAARADPGPRRGDGPRRLRDRLRLADAPAPAAAELRQDRPVVRAGPGDRPGGRAHRLRRHRPGGQPRPALDRRGRRDGGAARSAARPRLRPGPGLPVRPADAAGPGTRGDRRCARGDECST